MARYVQFSLLSVLASSAIAAPAPQQGQQSWGWQAGSWNPSDPQHRTVGTPINRTTQPSSLFGSTTLSTSSRTTTRTSVGVGPSATTNSHHSSLTLPASTASRSSVSPTFTTSKSTLTSTAVSISTGKSPLASTSTVTATSTSVISTSTSSSAIATATATSGKRGLAYNDASYASFFDAADEVTWGYNWYSVSNDLASSYNFVPMLWGSGNDFTDVWAQNVANSLAAGSTHLLAFNEPDLDTQSNMTPEAAAEAYMTYMQPYASQATLGSPAITNGDSSSMGFNWLSSFMDECSDCTVDYIALHWYNDPGTADDFKNHVTTAYETFGKPVWITEFGLNDPTNDEVVSFLEEVLPWLDEQNFVERYAYFMVAENYLLDSTGTTLSNYGSTFAAYTN